MIELLNDSLFFSFPEIHPKAGIKINFQRTLRIPDDGKSYPLPPGLGQFPMKHVDDYSTKVPPIWIQHGGVMLPMYQSEALWINFNPDYLMEHGTGYPFAIKVATGKINAVTGDQWQGGLNRKNQDYMVSTKQPWLDGYCVEKGFIRQFVAMPLGSGYSVEEQLTEKPEFGGIQIEVYPMKLDIFKKRFPKRKYEEQMIYKRLSKSDVCLSIEQPAFDMGLAPGGRMKQEIFDDPFEISDWDKDNSSRCFVHLANSLIWRAITGDTPPTVPFTSEEYNRYGLPWFDFYSEDATALEGSSKLKGLKSVKEMAKEKNDNPLPENESVTPENIVKLRQGLKKNQVRIGHF